jgi:membrane protein DedA with SNARE-associated domain
MTTLIDALGPFGVGVIILIETVFPPIPSEAVLPAAGYLAGLGRLDLTATIAIATVGSVAGALLLYWAGAIIGVRRLGRLATRMPLMSMADVERAWLVFERWQQPAVFWGRLVPGVRSLVSIPAGAQRMPLVRFVALTGAGSLIWNSALILAGWWLGDRYGATARASHVINLSVAVGAALFVVWFVARGVRARRRPDAGRLTGD